MDSVLAQVIASTRERLQAEGFEVTAGNAINYGWKLTVSSGNECIHIAIYNGKKGISFVVQGKAGDLKKRVEILCSENRITPDKKILKKEKPVIMKGQDLCPDGTPCWIGADESGKGDVFGPLVTAACLVTRAEAATLRSWGVTDSKALTDKRILELAGPLKDLLGDRACVTVLMPESYNYEYNKMEERGKNLNHLLGILHGKNIKCLLLKYKCPCIIVDKFGKDEYVLTALGSVAAGKTIIQVTKGERDTAVAAASVLARAAFIESMNELEDRFHMSFPKGAFAGIETALTAFCGNYGNKELYKVGKLNFKTFDSLR